MQITGFNTPQCGVSAKRNNTGLDKTSFKSHKLVRTFKMPGYDGVTGAEYILGNLQKVVAIPMPGKPIGVTTVVKVGSLNEKDEQRGISHFREHLGFDGSRNASGTKKLPAGGFDKIAEGFGADINAFTSFKSTAYLFGIAGAKPKELAQVLDAHATMVKYPKIAPSQYKKEQEVVIKEINQGADEPDDEQFFKLMKSLYGIQSTSKELIAGREENIRNLAQKDLAAFQKQNYTPDNMETYIVGGDISAENLAKMADKAFDTPDFRPGTVQRKYEDVHMLEKTKFDYTSSPQVKTSSVVLGFAGPQNKDARANVAADAAILWLAGDNSSILDKSLAKINTSSSVGLMTASNHPNHAQLMYIEVGSIAPGKEQKALDIVRKSIQSLKKKPITPEKLEKIKSNMLYGFKKRNEKVFSQRSSSVSGELKEFSTKGGLDAYLDFEKHVKSLTPEDIQKALVQHLDTKKAAVSVLQPQGKETTNLTFSGRKVLNSKFISKKVLGNNMTFVANDNPTTLFTSGLLKLSSPVRAKTGVAGILADILKNATAKTSESKLAERLSENNIHMRISTNSKGLLVNIESEKEKFGKALDIAKEALFAPALTEKNFQKAMGDAKAKLASRMPDAEDRALEETFGDHPLGESPRKIKENLDNITLKDVKDYYKALMGNATAQMVVTGPLSSGEKNILPEVEKSLSETGCKFNPAKVADAPIAPLKGKVCVVQAEEGRTQSHIFQVFRTPVSDVKEKAALMLLNSILGDGLSSRIFKDLREKQKLAYQAGSKFISSPNPYASCQAFVIKTDIKTGSALNDNMEKSINGFRKHINKVLHSPVKDAELARAKRAFVSDTITALQTAGGQTTQLAISADTPAGTEYINKICAAAQKVTPEDIRNVAKKYLSGPSVISIVTTKEAVEAKKDFLAKQGELKVF